MGRVNRSDATLTGVEDARPRARSWLWLAPALTFVAGLLLGWLLLGGSPTDAGPQVGAPAPSTISPAPSAPASDALARVPEPCLALADQTETAFAVFDRAVDAVRQLDARRLQEAVDDVQVLRPQAQDLAAQCRSRAGQDALGGDTVTPVPTPDD
jgi:hypothetical protein